MASTRRRVPEQLVRLGAVVVLLVVAIVAVRVFLLSPSLLNRDLHVSETIARETALEPSFGGAPVCLECHEEQGESKLAGYHRNLSCETCHGPAWAHAQDPTDTLPEVPREREFCPRCHAYDPSRPTGFPQINPILHNPMQRCTSCHDAHNPEPPEVPKSCQACHNEIARAKAVSHHALIECTQCHETPARHFSDPRAARPSKPTTREFCGTCHGQGARGSGAPRIDIERHGEKYVCWDCHYPHMPEA